MRQRLAHDRAPLCLAQIGSDAEHGQLVVPELRDLIGLAPQQDVDALPSTEPLVALPMQPQHRRQQHLRRNRAVPRLRGLKTGVAVTAGAGRLPEVLQQIGPAALHRLAQGQHRVEVAAEHPAPLGVAGRGVDQTPLQHDILQTVGEPGGRWLAVTSSSAGLLVIPLDGLRQIEMDHESHIRFVDTHAEGDGGHHDQTVLTQKP